MKLLKIYDRKFISWHIEEVKLVLEAVQQTFTVNIDKIYFNATL